MTNVVGAHQQCYVRAPNGVTSFVNVMLNAEGSGLPVITPMNGEVITECIKQ